jgi:hypothetical protein
LWRSGGRARRCILAHDEKSNPKPLEPCGKGEHMARAASKDDFVLMVAQEVSSGIERGLNYWMGRIELEVVDRSLSTAERIYAIEQILQEYRDTTNGTQFGYASA